MNNANRPLSSSRRLPSFVLTGIIIAAQMSPAYSQAIPDERNTIEVFKRVAAGVVHVQALRVVAPGEGDAVAGQPPCPSYSKAGLVALTNCAGRKRELRLLLVGKGSRVQPEPLSLLPRTQRQPACQSSSLRRLQRRVPAFASNIRDR